MEFIYAENLKQEFDVYGHFYNLKLSDTVLKCRSLLEIKRKGLSESNGMPDTIVIMMNPGSSIPLDKEYTPKTFSKTEYNNLKEKEIIPTRPDNAQYQIMRLMQLNNWNFVRVLNLSDLRNGNSGNFQIDFNSAKALDDSNPHCITSINRRKELLASLKSKSNSIIVAWGSLTILKNSAEEILKMDNKIIGIVNRELPYFRYPSPYLKTQKLDWLLEMQSMLNNE